MRANVFSPDPNLLYVIPRDQHSPKSVARILENHPEVRYVSLVGVDLSGHDTDEKIPIGLFLSNIEQILSGGVQTDGSSVVLTDIATLNDAKVDLIADSDVNWFVDYNFDRSDQPDGRPAGTLRIPAFLQHNNQLVCSRSLLLRAQQRFNQTLRQQLKQHPPLSEEIGITPDAINHCWLNLATELEFWVRTPQSEYDREQLSVSQGLKEQYWKRTKGSVRTALEHAIDLLGLYGLKPEMGHKEVGGVQAKLAGSGQFDQIMEQLEIDWQYADALQAADNELFARIFIKEVFRQHGLEASFLAKPIDGVAGSGEHCHVSAFGQLDSGETINLFAPADLDQQYLSRIGWGALMGIMKHYDVISPFITASNDAFKRLKPGFEAPTHPAASLGLDKQTPSRNRTVLLGLVRQQDQSKATRFELRSPNPHTNSYIALAAISQCMLDGIEHAAKSGLDAGQLEQNFSKSAGDPAVYLNQDRQYRCEKDMFEDFDDEQRDQVFGKPPTNVYETLRILLHENEGLTILCQNGVFSDTLLSSYSKAMLTEWEMELRDRILPECLSRVRACKPIHQPSDYDNGLWEEIDALRQQLAKDTQESVCLFNEIRQAMDASNLRLVAQLQQKVEDDLHRLEYLYNRYSANQLN